MHPAPRCLLAHANIANCAASKGILSWQYSPKIIGANPPVESCRGSSGWTTRPSTRLARACSYLGNCVVWATLQSL